MATAEATEGARLPPGPPGSLAEELAGYAARGRRLALIHRGRYRTERWSYAALARWGGSFAGRLIAAGVTAGDRVAVRGPNSPGWAAAFLGCVHAGAVAVPLDASAAPEVAARVAARAGCGAAIVRGDDPWEPAIPRLDLAAPPAPDDPPAPPLRPAAEDQILEIVFTSGTTGSPRGVVITHGNILAYLRPVYAGYHRRRRWVDPLLPVRVLCVPPLSHLFGQAVGLFLPLMLGCTVVYADALDTASLRRTLRREKVVMAAVVPRILEGLRAGLRSAAAAEGWDLEPTLRRAAGAGLLRRIWNGRRAQRWMGWWLRGFVVGGAPLDPGLERFWRRLGYALVQGYGLSETAPVVTLSHPFRDIAGTVGRPLRGQEVRVAEDGEILVRGANVMRGYWEDPAATRAILGEDGWLHTGDLGRLAPDGQIQIVGRKKEVIVTAEGLNVHPEDVEDALRRTGEIREAVVLGAAGDRGEVVRAVLLPRAGAPGPAEIVAAANRGLEPHQRIRQFTVWPGADFPRTATWKVRRAEVAAAVAGGAAVVDRGGEPLTALLADLGVDPGALRPGATLAELGLSSLDLVEAAVAVEERFGVEVDDAALTAETTVEGLRRLAGGGAAEGTGLQLPMPRWSRSRPAAAVRWMVRDGLILPAVGLWTPLHVEGLHHLRGLAPPVLFAANHVSLLDVPVICRALPRSWRRLLAPAATAEWFRPWFQRRGQPPVRVLLRGLHWGLAALLFQVFPLPRGQGFRRSLQHAGELVDAGLCPLVFPEGTRSSGGVLPFQPGVGLMAARLRIPVVPVAVEGLLEVLPRERWVPRRGAVQVRFGPAVRPGTSPSPARITAAVEGAVRRMAEAPVATPNREG